MKTLRVILLVGESVLMVGLLYKVADSCLLARDGVITVGRMTTRLLAYFPALLILGSLSRRLTIRPGRESVAEHLVAPILLSVVLLRLSLEPPSKGQSGLWIPLEWHKLPNNFILMANISPVETLALALLVCGLAALLLRPALGWFSASTLVAAGLLTLAIVKMPAERRLAQFVVSFVSPLALAALAALMRRPLWASRFLVASALGAMLFLHYGAYWPLLPYRSGNALARAPGVEQVYPSRGGPPAFPLTSMRDLIVEPDRRQAFTTFGPASGVARLELSGGRDEVLEIHGLSRYLWTEPSLDYLVSADWDTGDLLKVSKEPFQVLLRKDVLDERHVAPWAITGFEQRLFVTFHEMPILAEYDLDSLQLRRDISFKATGETAFNSGLYDCAYDRRTDHLYVELGMVDETDRFAVLKVRASDFAVEEKAYLPEGGLELALVEPHGTLIAASFFSGRLYEVGLDPLAVRRVLKGPLNTRMVSFDRERDVLYALGFLSGELQVLRYADGALLARHYVGRKSQSLYHHAGSDSLYVGGGEGLYRISLPEFAASWNHA